MRSCHLLVALSIVALGASGCSISTSISKVWSSPYEWSSDSSSSSSDSSSSSSGGDEAAYQQDVSDLTVAFAANGGELDAFRADIGALAEQRGIVSWEEDFETCASVGRGARQAQLDQLATVEFGERLFGDNPISIDAYRVGYATVR